MKRPFAARRAAAASGLRRDLGRAVRTGAKLGIAMVAVSLVLAGGAFAATTFYGQYGSVHAEVNTSAWANRAASYSRTGCENCHQAVFAVRTTSVHAKVTCQVCHAPVAEHPGTVPGVLVGLPTPTSAICVTCHAKTAGRPASFAQVDPSQHYSGGACLRCHDPHTIKANRPPDVTHPLASLPACTTCHAPDGLKKVPAGHELVADAVCLSCHQALKPTR